MDTKRDYAWAEFWGLWALTSTVSWAVVFPLKGDLLWPPGWLLAGIVMGASQAILLRYQVPRGQWWLWWALASAVGWAGSMFVVGLATGEMADIVVLELLVAAAVPVGVLQGLTMRRPLAAAAWTAANVLAVGVGLAVTVGVSIVVGPVTDVAVRIACGGLFGVSQGVVTASVAFWLLRKRFSDVPGLGDSLPHRIGSGAGP